MQKPLLTLLFTTAFISMTSCAPVIAQRGNMLEEHQIQEVKVGEHSRTDILHILGSPTTQSTFNTNVWYYIGQETEKHGILDDEVTKERIVSVVFDDNGIVQKVENIDPNRNDIPYERKKTPTHGNELTFMQQLLGNMGRFNGNEDTSPTDMR